MKMKGVFPAACLAIALATPCGDALSSPYMGDPVEFVKASNGAITHKKVLDRVGNFAWLKPTIEDPAQGVWVFGAKRIFKCPSWRLITRIG